jgi:UDP-N-acetylmuramate dehydrogenase
MYVRQRLSSFALPGEGSCVVRFKTMREASAGVQAAHRRGLPTIPLGAGTNCVFLEPKLSAVFLQSCDRSLAVKRAASKTLITAGAGLPWDDLVRFAARHDLSGLEYLSGIPGTCGAAPVQNIGAYGAELAASIRSVEVLNLKTLQFQKLSREECGFGYRRSIFNTSERGLFLIGSITLEFTRGRSAAMPDYPELGRFTSLSPSLSELRHAILRIRRKKLPDYKTTPNCGSFFKNPVVGRKAASAILKCHPDIPHWPSGDGDIKFSAAWLIDHSGLRNRHWGNISISTKHALVLINTGETEHKNLRFAIEKITAVVYKAFGVDLETEPNLLDKSYVANFVTKQSVSCSRAPAARPID